MKLIGIYKITSPSGKIYIGQSCNIEDRKYKYKQLNCNAQIKLYNSLKKYGWNQHQFEIIEECPESYLNELETWWKLFYNSVEDGLNCCYWDKQPMRGKKQSLETIQKRISKTKGKKRTEEFKLTLSKINKGKQHRLGHKHSEETKQKMSNSSKNKLKSKKHKFSMSIPILQYDFQGNFIKEWKGGATEAGKQFGKNVNININQCCRNIQKSCKGYKWEYKFKIKND